MSLQQMVEQIAVRLGRPVLVEDRKQWAVAYSPHNDAIDDVRRDSILRRHAGPEVAQWIRSLGVQNSREPIRTPMNHDLHMLPRVCVPIWRSQWPLGYLWFIDESESMDSEEIHLASDMANQLAEEWHSEKLRADQALARQAFNVRELLLGGPEAVERSSVELTDTGAFERGSAVTAFAVLPLLDSPAVNTEELKDRIERTLRTAARNLGNGNALHHTRPDHGVLLYATYPDLGKTSNTQEVAKKLQAAGQRWLTPLIGVSGVVVGVGATQPSITQARDSYLDASMAARTSATFNLDPIVHWRTLGAYRALSTMAAAGLKPSDVHTGIEKLALEKDGGALLETLECYLDVGGHAQAAATKLNLHRTSMYYRLERIQRLVSVDLQDGQQRLSLHLAAKLARVTGFDEESS